MEAIVEYRGGVKFEAEARGHRVVCDQPLDNGGADAGMSPPEFLLVSLGTCAAFYAAQYLKTRSLASEGLQVKVHADKVPGPARLGTFRIEIVVPGLDDERHRQGILRAAQTCLIHNTLLHAPSIEFAVNSTAPAGV